MSTCSSQGGCNQIAFQSGMWQNQAPHQPMQTSPQMINGYRERSIREETQLRIQRESMARQNMEAVEKQQVASEIVALRAKLENKPDKRNSTSPNSKKPSESTTPEEKKTPIRIEDYKQAFPALTKVFDESKAQKTPPPRPSQASQPVSLIDRYRKSYPALMKNYVPNPVPQTATPQQQPQAPTASTPAPNTNETTRSRTEFVLNAPESNSFPPAYNSADYLFDFSDESDSQWLY